MIRTISTLSIISVCAVFGHGAWAQSYSPLYSPSSTQPIYWSCVDQNNNPIPYAGYEFETYYWTNTNGHFHDDPNYSHPYSSLSPTSGYDTTGVGYFATNLQTTIIGQAEGIDGVCYDVYGNPAYGEFDYAVGYPGIYWVENDAVWVQLGGNRTMHGDNSFNHWMTSNAAYGIYWTSYKYIQDHPDQDKIGQNDEALPFGGKFDIRDNWQSPHITHDWGTAADIRGNGNPYSIPNAYQEEFTRDCSAFQAIEFIIEYVGTSAQHIHCRWAY